MKFAFSIKCIFLLLIGPLVIHQSLAKNSPELRYLEIRSYQAKTNIAHHINETLKEYLPLQEFLLSTKGAPSHKILIKTIDDSLSHTGEPRPSKIFSLVKKWSLNRKSMMEQYYGIYEFHECSWPLSQLNIRPPFDLRQFAQLQADFFTYFKYSVAASLVTGEDIENEVTNFINYHNLLSNKCQLGLASKATIIQLYSLLIDKILIPMVQNNYLNNKKLLAIANSIQWKNTTNLSPTIMAEYSIALNKLNDSWLKKESNSAYPSKYNYPKDLFNKERSKVLLDEFFNKLQHSSSQYFSKSSLDPIDNFLNKLTKNVEEIEQKKNFKNSNVIGKKIILAHRQMDVILPLYKTIHLYNMNVTKLFYLIGKKLYPKKIEFTKYWKMTALPKNPETQANYAIDAQKNLIHYQQLSIPL